MWGRDNEREDGNPQASGTVRLQDSLNTVLLRDGGMNDAYTCGTQRNGSREMAAYCWRRDGSVEDSDVFRFKFIIHRSGIVRYQGEEKKKTAS